MGQTANALSFASLAYIFALGIGAFVNWISHLLLLHVRIGRFFGIAISCAKSCRDSADLLNCILGLKRHSCRPKKAALTALAAIMCINGGIYAVFIILALRILMQGLVPLSLLIILSSILSLGLSIPIVIYVTTGGRRGFPGLPEIPTSPWVIANELRIKAAASVVRRIFMELVIISSAAAVYGAVLIRLQAPDVDLSAMDSRFLALLAGLLPQLLIALLAIRIHQRLSPRTAAYRMTLDLIALGGGRRTGRSAKIVVKDRIADQATRRKIRELCILINQFGSRIARSDLKAGVQNPNGVICQSISGSLRRYLSTPSSLHPSCDDIRSDLQMILTFLCTTRSGSIVGKIASRFKAFQEDGSPHDAFLNERSSMALRMFSRFHVGVEKTHQSFTRIVAILLIATIAILVVLGKVKVEDLTKIVKV